MVDIHEDTSSYNNMDFKMTKTTIFHVTLSQTGYIK